MWSKAQVMPSGLFDDLLDDNYVSNGDLWFDSNTMQLSLWSEESNAWLPVAPPTTLEDRVVSGEATQQNVLARDFSPNG